MPDPSSFAKLFFLRRARFIAIRRLLPGLYAFLLLGMFLFHLLRLLLMPLLDLLIFRRSSLLSF